MNIGGFGDENQCSLIVVTKENEAHILIEEEVKAYIEEAEKNGVDLRHTFSGMLMIAAMAMRQGIFPHLTSRIVGRG